jgi:hypothetical protein
MSDLASRPGRGSAPRQGGRRPTATIARLRESPRPTIFAPRSRTKLVLQNGSSRVFLHVFRGSKGKTRPERRFAMRLCRTIGSAFLWPVATMKPEFGPRLDLLNAAEGALLRHNDNLPASRRSRCAFRRIFHRYSEGDRLRSRRRLPTARHFVRMGSSQLERSCSGWLFPDA